MGAKKFSEKKGIEIFSKLRLGKNVRYFKIFEVFIYFSHSSCIAFEGKPQKDFFLMVGQLRGVWGKGRTFKKKKEKNWSSKKKIPERNVTTNIYIPTKK